MKRSGLFLVFLSILFLCHGSAFGEFVEIYPSKDANVKFSSYNRQLGDQNFNNGEFNTGDQHYQIGGNNWAYIQFDLQDAPAQVKSAKLRLYNRGFYNPPDPYERCTIASGYVDLYKVLGDWTEEGITYNSQPTYGSLGISTYILHNSDEYIEFDITSLYHNWKTYPEGNFGLKLNTRGSNDRCRASSYYFGCYPGVFYSADSDTADKWPRLILEIDNHPPVAEAGDNLSVSSDEVSSTVIAGSASDPDDDALEYRWLVGGEILMDWSPVEDDGRTALEMNGLTIQSTSASPAFTVGEHTLTLEVTDGQVVSSDSMMLTVGNSAPEAAVGGAGVFEYGAEVALTATVSDYDGDLLNYAWSDGGQILCNGEVQSLSGGAPVELPVCSVNHLDFGINVLSLSVDDGINVAIQKQIEVEITDLTKPTLAPVASRTVLWPPNHRMKRVIIYANASDNSGGPVRLSVAVSSNEPESGLWRRDRSPDWVVKRINQRKGKIVLKLRAERSGGGEGRVYTILITATDQYDNSSESQLEVLVPHDRGRHVRGRVRPVSDQDPDVGNQDPDASDQDPDVSDQDLDVSDRLQDDVRDRIEQIKERVQQRREARAERNHRRPWWWWR